MNLNTDKINTNKTALILMICTLISKLFGFIREIVFSYFYGTSYISDAYLFSLTFSTIIIGFIGIGFNTGYIPMYNRVQREKGKFEADRFTSILTTAFIFISIIVIILCIIFMKPLVYFLAGGFNIETMKVAISFCRISVIGILATGIIYIYKGYLQLHNNYIVPTLIGIPLNIITIISIYFSDKNNIMILAVGSLIATFSELLVLLPFLRKKNYKYSINFNFRNPYLIKMLCISLPLILSVATNQISVMIDKSLASQFIGGISTLSYSNLITSLITDTVTLSVITASYPILTKQLQSNDFSNGKKTLSSSIGLLLMILVPCTLGIFVCGEQIIRVIYERGAFDNNSVIMTTSVFKAYAIGLIFIGIRQILIRQFYALQETKIPVINSTIAIIVNIVLNFIFLEYIGLVGVALSTSISTIVSAVLMIRSTKIRMGYVIENSYYKEYLKILISSTIMLCATYLVKSMCIDLSPLLLLIITISFSVLVYGISLYVLKTKQFIEILNSVKKFKRS